MKLLLDTHILLWWLAAPDRLSGEAQKAIADPENAVFFSAASTWEIAIKIGLGKLGAVDLEKAVEHLRAQTIVALPVEPRHTLGVLRLPHHHKDPFDRLLLAQAKVEGLTFVTRDRLLQRYDAALMLG